jgi:hypothetical protein
VCFPPQLKFLIVVSPDLDSTLTAWLMVVWTYSQIVHS